MVSVAYPGSGWIHDGDGARTEYSHQEMSLTKLGLSEIPALASKMDDSVEPRKSVETTSSSV